MKTSFISKSIMTGAALLGILFLNVGAFAQTSWPGFSGLPPDSPKVLITGVDASYYRAEIPFVEHVENRSSALVLVEITSGQDATGTFISLVLTGLQAFDGLRDTLMVRPTAGESTEETRKNVVRTLKLGLMRFVTKTPIAARVDIAFQEQVKPTAVVDPWNFWVFSLGANGMLNGDSVYKSQMWFGNVSARRITPEWKISLGFNLNSQKNVYSYEGFDYESEMNSRNLQSLVVRSIDDHWSVGATVTAGASTFNNTSFSLAAKPAVEFDVFPYSESTKKQLRVLYSIGPEFVRYREETIYDKRKETLWGESLSVSLDLKRSWGSMSVSLAGSHYFHDLEKNRVNLNGSISWRIFEGLNFNISGGGARIRDQLSLIKGGASLEEVLLRRRQLETGYNYYFSVGLSYTFGSVNSHVVNPRFGSSGGGIGMSF